MNVMRRESGAISTAAPSPGRHDDPLCNTHLGGSCEHKKPTKQAAAAAAAARPKSGGGGGKATAMGSSGSSSSSVAAEGTNGSARSGEGCWAADDIGGNNSGVSTSTGGSAGDASDHAAAADGPIKLHLGFAPFFNLQSPGPFPSAWWLRAAGAFLFAFANNLYAFQNLAFAKSR